MSSIVHRLMLALVLLVLTPAVALADWRRAESDHFIVYSDGSERALRDYAVKLERFHSLLRARFGGPAQDDLRKLPVYLVGDGRALRIAQPNLPSGIAGYYTASENDIYAILIRGQDDDLLLHEYTHHFMANAGQGQFPGWFSEGLAEYYATATVSAAGAATFGMPNTGRLRLLQGRWLPMDQLLNARGSFDIDSQTGRGMYYAQSWLLTHWLLADPSRARALGAYLNALNAGLAPVDAWQASFGLAVSELEAILKAYARGRLYYSQLNIPPITPEVTVSSLPPSWDAVILPLINSRSPRPEETDGPALLATSRANAARFPDDALALTALGRAERRWGEDPAAAEAALARALAIDPTHAEALLLMAAVVGEGPDAAQDQTDIEQRRGQALDLLNRAREADPTDYRVYADLARLRRDAEDYPTHDDLMTWAMAARYAPQVMSIRGDAAIAMLAGERYDEAIVLLIPIANDPHGGPGVQYARSLQARAEQMRDNAEKP